MKDKELIIQGFKSYLSATKLNAKGISVRKRVVIIESDDWGAIRTPSKEAILKFRNKGLDVANSKYQNDALASQEDLELLFDVLQKYKGGNNKPVKITANAIMANPDFEKIKNSGYKEFHYEIFTETFKKYPKHEKNLSIWKQGIKNDIFQPQYHGREHLNYKRWMRVLQMKNEAALFCFENNATYSGNGDYSFMEAYDWDTKDDIPEQRVVIEEGLKIFESIFGFKSKSFIAPCYNWDPEIEDVLAANEIKWIQGIQSQLQPTGVFDYYIPLRHQFGDTNKWGQKYNVRNCVFEPSMSPNRDWVNSCLAQIASAFLWNKPAVICSHRINYVGFINENNRDRGLRDLDNLLKAIINKWPDVHFISTDELDHYLK